MNNLGIYNDINIALTDDKLINLTQMHKAADGRMSQRVPKWMELKSTQKFLKSLCNKLKVRKTDVINSMSGKGGGTYGHWQIAMAYAKYLSPEFHIWCNEKVKQAIEFEANPDFLIKVATP